MKAALIFLAVVVTMASAAGVRKNYNPSGVNFVDNSPPINGNGGVTNNYNPSGVNFVDNSPPINGNGGVKVVDNNPDDGQQVHIVDNVDPLFNQPHKPEGSYEPIDIGPAIVEPQQGCSNGGYEPIGTGPAYVGNDRPKQFPNPLARGGK
ncbi:unnamed protein product [Chilo suppressalis]|uniref:Uncharacterized protein n=1 Tax=Chilo suppressalis TaxID=168631 RepID=A0ABN8AY98_CHISP|nr:unnamed protein product [Chilo suppressalis]